MDTPQGNPYRLDQLVVARVEQVFPFGVFVRLPDGTRAYVRRRELTRAGNIDPRQVVSEGDTIKASVIALAEPSRNLELSARRAKPDPWQASAQSLRVRDTVTATVKSLSTKGVLVQVYPGVDGFIPLAELAPWPVDQPDHLVWVGDHVEAMITHLDRQNKRMRLSIRQQMQHEAIVGKVMASLSRSETPKAKNAQEENAEIAEAEDKVVDPNIAQTVGWILVLEDHEEVRKPLVAWLRRRGFSAEGAGSPARALQRLSKRTYNLALIDLDLSGEDGLGFIRTLEQEGPDIKVAVISAPDWIAQRSEELAALGVIDAFFKPLNLDEIYEALVLLGRGETPGPLWSPTSELDKEEAQSSFQTLAHTMRSGLSLADRFKVGLEELVRFTRAEEGIVFHLDPESQQAAIVAEIGTVALNRGAIYALVASPVKDVIYERREVFEPHVSKQARGRFSKLLELLPFESCLGVPISAQGNVEHALFLFHREANTFATYRLRDAQAMATLFSVALENQALDERIREVSPLLLSGQLAAGFSHEVYNKMSGLEIQLRNLKADCERLVQKKERPPESREFIDVNQATDQLLDVAFDMKETLEHFRDLMRAERQEGVEVNEVIQRAVDLLRPTARQHRVRIEVDLTQNLPSVISSHVRLLQVFSNLILNAVQHTAKKMERWRDGRGSLRLTAEYVEEECRIQVRCIDNGPGIHRQLWETVFALGFSSRPGGTGLGLFIARSLVESMGGYVVVERSAIPNGTTFLVGLPVIAHQAEEREQ